MLDTCTLDLEHLAMIDIVPESDSTEVAMGNPESIIPEKEESTLQELLETEEQLTNISRHLQEDFGPHLALFINQLNEFLEKKLFDNAHSVAENFYNKFNTESKGLTSMLSFPVHTITPSEQNVSALVRYEFLQQKLSDFRIGFNHDLRSPFNGILGFLACLKEDDDLSDDEKKLYMQHVFHSVNKLPLLFEEILLLSGDTNFVDIPLRNLLSNDISQLEMRAKGKNVTLNLDIPESVSLFSDPSRLNAILRNILNNAIKFTKSGGTVSLDVHWEDDTILFSVMDTGVGLSNDALEEQQTLFAREVSTNITPLEHHSEGTQGESTTGQGLVLSKKYVDDIFGTITVESEEGTGTTYALSLPANKAEVCEKDCLAKAAQEKIIADEVLKRKKELLQQRFWAMFNGVMEKK